MTRPRSLPLLLALVLLAGAGCRRSAPPARPAASAQDRYRQPDRLLAALALRPGDTVADIGAGGGYLTVPLARAVGSGGRVVATDIDRQALTDLTARARNLGLGQIEARPVSADDPGLEPGRFDLILMAQVDHLLADRTAYLRRLRPALRPGGRIAISNSQRHRDGVEAAARQAGFRVEHPPVELPAQFLLILRPD